MTGAPRSASPAPASVRHRQGCLPGRSAPASWQTSTGSRSAGRGTPQSWPPDPSNGGSTSAEYDSAFRPSGSSGTTHLRSRGTRPRLPLLDDDVHRIAVRAGERVDRLAVVGHEIIGDVQLRPPNIQ